MKTLKLRIYPNKEQQVKIEKTIGCCRFIYNWALERRIHFYKTTGITLHKYELMKELTELKKIEVWLGEVSTQSLQQSIIRLDRAYTSFFRKLGKFPKFKSKKNPVQSFNVPQGFVFSPIQKNIKIPKIGVIHFRDKLNFRTFGKTRTLTIKRNGNKYYACVVVDTIHAKKEPPTFDKSVGIDLGVKTFATLSTGVKINQPKFHKNVSKAARQRKDFLHKLSTELVDNQDWTTLVIEELRLSEMVTNIKNINRAMFAQGWRMFFEMIKYKCEERGKNFIVVSSLEAASRTCTCGQKNANLTISDREWSCPCGATHDRDILAAQNIRKFGIGNGAVSAGAPHECKNSNSHL